MTSLIRTNLSNSILYLFKRSISSSNICFQNKTTQELTQNTNGYHKIGFIGTGNMAQAIIQGLINQKKFTPEQIYASDNDLEYFDFLKKNSPLFLVKKFVFN